MRVRVDKSMQDGKLSPDIGRLIVYGKLSFHSNGPSMDHNDLLTALASMARVNRSDVASRAYRFYWRPSGKNFINVSPVRKIDWDWVCDHQKEFMLIVEAEFGRKR